MAFSLAPPAFVQELIAQVTKRCTKLVSVLETVVVHDLMPADALDELQGPKGHKHIATDLVMVLRLPQARSRSSAGVRTRFCGLPIPRYALPSRTFVATMATPIALLRPSSLVGA